MPQGKKPGLKHRIFDYHDWTAQELWAAAKAYFEWSIANPLWESVLIDGTVVRIPKPRVFTIKALREHAGISNEKWSHSFDRDPEVAEMKEYINMIIQTQQLELAAAGLLNPGFIARIIGFRRYDNKRHAFKVETSEATVTLLLMSKSDEEVEEVNAS